MESKFDTWQRKSEEAKAHAKELNSYLDYADEMISQIVNWFDDNDNIEPINYDYLISVPFDVWIPVNKGVRFMHVKHPEKQCFYKTEMRPHLTDNKISKFGIQVHEDCIEITTVTKGELIEPLKLNKRYKKGESVTYQKGERHMPMFKVESNYDVEFIKK